MSRRVPFFRPDIDEQDVESVSAVLRSGWLTSGPMVVEFERQFRDAVGAPHAIAVSSCTGGLHAALVEQGIGVGDEVITTAMTFCGTVQAIEETGARAVLVDVADDLNLDSALVESAVSGRTRAILPVHVAGLPCEMDALERVAAKHGLAIVEDAAHAFGSAWNGTAIGASARSTAIFSFYANKNLTTGEGGMITTASAERAARLRRLIRHGIERKDPHAWGGWEYEVTARGLKCNMSDMLAALGVAQLKKTARHAARRREIAAYYAAELADLECVELPPERAGTLHAWHLYILRLRLEKLAIDRNDFVKQLGQAGVECSVHFRPIPMHSWYARFGAMRQWPRALEQYARVVSLPLYPAMRDDDVEHVAACVKRVAERFRKAI